MLRIRYLAFEPGPVSGEHLPDGWRVITDPRLLEDPLVKAQAAGGRVVVAGPVHVTNIALLAQAEAGNPRGVHFWVTGSDYNRAAVGRAFTVATYLDEFAATRNTGMPIAGVFEQLVARDDALFGADLIGWVPEETEKRRRTELVDLALYGEVHRSRRTPGTPFGDAFEGERFGTYVDAVNDRLEPFGLTPDFTAEEFLAWWRVDPRSSPGRSGSRPGPPRAAGASAQTHSDDPLWPALGRRAGSRRRAGGRGCARRGSG
jgi:hypothetical protein